VGAFQSRPGSLLANTDSGLLSLHLPEGISRGVSGLPEACFANQADTTLGTGVSLAALGLYGSDYRNPLIITVAETPGNYIQILMLGALSKLPHESLKRSHSAISSRGSRGSNGSEMNQPSFRRRILSRDKVCVLTGHGKLGSDACHIIPYVYFQKLDFVGKRIWDEFFPYSCDNPEHRVMDVRNGILMYSPLNGSFDKFDFTIIRTLDQYKVETLREDEFDEETDKELLALILGLDKKELFFNPDKKNEWPSEILLKFHNACFRVKREQRKQMKAQAEAQELEEDNSAQTIAGIAEATSTIRKWLEHSDGNVMALK
jgi:hypothetical protein